MQADHLKAIKQILRQNPSVVFAYFYGSSKDSEVYNDIDIAVFTFFLILIYFISDLFSNS